jgi:hypothetical protein
MRTRERERENGRLVINQTRMKQYNYVQQKKKRSMKSLMCLRGGRLSFD